MEFGRMGGVCLLLFVAMIPCLGHASDFYVGGRDGWTLNPRENFNHWAARNRFQVNDSLVFKYKKEADSVLFVKKEDYDICNTKDPIVSFHDGNSVFKVDRSGPFFFISGAPGNCGKGQKLIVVVLAVRPKTGAPLLPSPPLPPQSSPLPSPPLPPQSSPLPSPLPPQSSPLPSPPLPPQSSPFPSPPQTSPLPSTTPPQSSPLPSPSSPPQSSPLPSPSFPPQSSPLLSPSSPPQSPFPAPSSPPQSSPLTAPSLSPKNAPFPSPSASPKSTPTPSPSSQGLSPTASPPSPPTPPSGGETPGSPPPGPSTPPESPSSRTSCASLISGVSAGILTVALSFLVGPL
ncbi:early nodulin-like protein 4 [Aristolochia californica]|uniref:early nodulin-like protein 4 n=1 Tax=Aristolochia californica TaxID=171875 RepID=UPI0035DB3102